MTNQQRLERNIPLIYLLNGAHMFIILLPVIVPYFKSLGLNMQQIYLLQSVFAASVLLLELPSGYISDLLGRKKSLIISCSFSGIGFTLLSFSSDFLTLCIAEVLLAIGVSLFSGTDISLLYDSLEHLKIKKAPIKIVGRKIFYQQSGEMIAGLVGGWLVVISIKAPAIAQAICAWLPLFVTFFLYEPERKKMDHRNHRENFRYIYKSLFSHSRLLTLIILNSMFYGVATLVAVWSFQHYWKEINIPITYFGYLWAISNATVAIIGRYAHKIEKIFGSVNALLIMALLPIISYFGVASIETYWGVLFCFTFQICRGINYVVLKDGLNRRVPADMRATANSVVGLGVRVLFIVMGPLAGYGLDKFGTKATFLTFAGFYVLVFVFLLIPLILQRKNYDPIPK